jgi:hypothetical protein
VDPLQELVVDIESTGKPSLAWIVRWSHGGRDPVAAAWEECRNSNYMALILRMARKDSATVAMAEIAMEEAYWRAWDKAGRPLYGEHSGMSDGADAIRKLGIKPPTLAGLLASRK